MSGATKVHWLCEALAVSRSGYYDWCKRRRQPGRRELATLELRGRIREAFERSRKTYGSPRIARVLKGLAGRHRIARLMRQEHLCARQRSKYRPATTDSRHNNAIAPNLLPTLTIQRPDQAWATDATCVITAEGWLYIVALIDLHTRRIVGWSMGANLDTSLTLKSLKMAILQRHPKSPVLVHSDRGTQFASNQYRQLLADNNFVASMSRKGNCYDNAYIESFWSSLKYETVYRCKYATRAEARQALFDYIEIFYNRTRLHSALGYQSPQQFEDSIPLSAHPVPATTPATSNQTSQTNQTTALSP
jgi:transposase InsO family protein